MFKARILINEQANDGSFSRSFLIKMARMGASVVVSISNGTTFDLSNGSDFMDFKNWRGIA